MIGLWTNRNGDAQSHANGLNEDQIQYLHNLKVGDRLVLFVNEVREGEKGPNYTLKRSTFTRENANA